MTPDPELFTATSGLMSVRYRGKELYSPVDPLQGILKKIRILSIPEQSLLFIPSPLLFHGFDTLLQMVPESSHILCVEYDEKLMALSLSQAPEEYIHSDRITYIRTDSINGVLHTLRESGIWRYRRSCLVTLSNGYSLYPSFYRDCERGVQAAINRYWQNKRTLMEMGPGWIRNIFRNLPFCSESYSAADLRFVKPVVVTGAGESLEHSLPMLKRLREKICIVAADTSFPVLTQNDIQPDFIIAVESQVSNMKDFIGNVYSKIPVIFDLTCFPGIHRVFTGRKYFMLSEFTRCRLIGRLSECLPSLLLIPPLGSVGVIALYLASLFSKGPVFFTGLDFSYILGKPHARGAPSHVLTLSQSVRTQPPGYYGRMFSRPLIRCMDKNGKPVYSDLILESYAKQIVSLKDITARAYDTGSSGIATGCRTITSEKDVERIITSYRPGISKKRPVTGTAGSAVTLLEEELNALTEIISHGSDYLTGSSPNQSPAKVLKKLKERDYVYIHFPEHPPLPGTDTGFLKRSLVSATYYRNIIRQVLSSMIHT